MRYRISFADGESRDVEALNFPVAKVLAALVRLSEGAASERQFRIVEKRCALGTRLAPPYEWGSLANERPNSEVSG